MEDLVQESFRHNVYFGLLVAVVIGALGFLMHQVKKRDEQIEKIQKESAKNLADKNKEMTEIMDRYNMQRLAMQKETLQSINIQANMTANIEKLVSGVLERIEKGFDKIEANIRDASRK